MCFVYQDNFSESPFPETTAKVSGIAVSVAGGTLQGPPQQITSPAGGLFLVFYLLLVRSIAL